MVVDMLLLASELQASPIRRMHGKQIMPSTSDSTLWDMQPPISSMHVGTLLTLFARTIHLWVISEIAISI